MKNTILACVACTSIGILTGGMLGLPLGLAIGYRTPRHTSIEASHEQASIPSIEGGKPAYVNQPIFKPSITTRPRHDIAGPAQNPNWTEPREKFKLYGRTSTEAMKSLGRPDRTATGRGKPYKDGINILTPHEEYWFYENRSVDPVSGKVDHLAKLTFQSGVCSGVDFE